MGAIRRIIQWFHRDMEREEFNKKNILYKGEGGIRKKRMIHNTSRELSGLHFLIVDDMDAVVVQYKEMLEREGAVADVANHARQALRLFEDSPAGYYQVIIADMGLEDMDGEEMSAVIRNMKRSDRDDVIIIALTGLYEEEKIRQLFLYGIDYHIYKPLSILQLKKILYEGNME